ncbi:hypothetical protein MSAN_01653700 [Mycena sanguinolenta]|uniref:Uncharacterized protein n=1 Tax=Mycena sanguinolenta TaxID=230812 RepID=A0A8H6Y2Q4_9AGAR|nr:hypothetical protein MSAN_01653700 [Mycena sanguinolenta]
MRWFRLPPRVKLKPLSAPNQTPSSRSTDSTFSDVTWISLCALRDSADAFPPLKSAVSGVVALWEIAKRAKSSKTDGRDIALRAKEIVDVIADAVPDGSDIPPPMLQSIVRFTVTLEEIRIRMTAIALTKGFSRLTHLRQNEETVRGIKARLDHEYQIFLTASALRLELQQQRIAAEQAQQQLRTQSDIQKGFCGNR